MSAASESKTATAEARSTEAEKCYVCLERATPKTKPSFLYGCSANGARHVACEACLHAWLRVTPSCPQCRAPSALILEVRHAPPGTEHEQLPWHLAKQYVIPQKLLDDVHGDEEEDARRVETLEELQFQLSLANDVDFRPLRYRDRASNASLARADSALSLDDDYDEDDDDDFSSGGCTESSDEASSFSVTEEDDDDDDDAVAFTERIADKRKRRTYSESNYERYMKRARRDDNRSYQVDEDCGEEEEKDEIEDDTTSIKQAPRRRRAAASSAKSTIDDDSASSSLQVRSVSENESGKRKKAWRSARTRRRK